MYLGIYCIYIVYIDDKLLMWFALIEKSLNPIISVAFILENNNNNTNNIVI